MRIASVEKNTTQQSSKFKVSSNRPVLSFDSVSLHGSVLEHVLDVHSPDLVLEPGINTSLLDLVDQLEELYFSNL